MKVFFDKFFKIIQERKFIAKSFSLVMSILLWAYLGNTKSGELKFKIPIVTKHLRENLIVSGISDKSVIAIFEGKKDYLKTINIKNIQAYVNLDNAKINKSYKYPIEMFKNEIPVSLKVRFLKKFVTIKVEKRISKRIKVTPVITGKVKKGFILGKIKVEPQFITINGASSLIKKINEIYTSKMSVENSTEDIKREVDLERDKDLDINYSETNVLISVPIINYDNLYSLDLVPVINNKNSDFSYVPVVSTVKVYIKYSGEKIEDGVISAVIDAGDINYNKIFKNKKSIKKDLTVKINISKIKEQTEIVSIIPEKIKVTISKIK